MLQKGGKRKTDKKGKKGVFSQIFKSLYTELSSIKKDGKMLFFSAFLPFSAFFIILSNSLQHLSDFFHLYLFWLCGHQ